MQNRHSLPGASTPNLSEQKRELNFISLFSGCGGLDLGFTSQGFQCLWGVDHDPQAVAVHKKNLGSPMEKLDVTDPTFEDRLSHIGTCDVLLGGFPCQGFSKAGPKNRNDQRNSLYKAMISALHIVKPKLFIAENVDGLVQNFAGEILHRIVDDCTAAGYRVEWKVLDAAWFGVPQHRRRVFIVGVRSDLRREEFKWPQATHRWVTRNGERSIHPAYPNWADALKDPVTLSTALDGLSSNSLNHDTKVRVTSATRAILQAVPEGKKLCNARHDHTSIRTWDIPEAFGPVTTRERQILETIVRNRRHKKYGSIPNGNPLSFTILTQLVGEDLRIQELDSLTRRGFLKKTPEPKWDVRGAMFASGNYRRPRGDLPSPTVLTVFHNPRYFAHPTEPRPFSVREAARLQTFPDWFDFSDACSKRENAFRLIGNAVPPLLAEKLALATRSTLINLSNTNAA